MYTCCPECSTCFRITNAQLAVAQGKVRCGKCSHVFNAKAHLTEQLPAKQKAVTEQAPPSAKPAAPVQPKTAAPEESLPQNQTESDFIDLTAPGTKEPEETALPPVEKPSSASGAPKFIDTTELPDSSALADSLFDDSGSSTEQAQAGSRYQYSDITDNMETESDIDDILEEMNEQLTLAMESPLPDIVPRGNKKTDTEENEIIGAIDHLFDETQIIDTTTAVEEDTVDTGDDEHAIEKAFLHKVEVEHPEALTELADDRRDEQGTAASAISGAGADTEEEVIPLRLRDSLQIQPPRKRSIWLTLAAMLFSLLLLVLLAGQLALFRNMELANAYPPLQPWLNQFCSYLPCRYDMQRDIEQIKLLSRDVRAHPKVESALLINAAMVNQAGFKQPYPDLLITLFDLSGNVVAKRRFTPADYMGKLNSPFLLMTPNTPVQITLEVVDPGNNAINFEFEFL